MPSLAHLVAVLLLCSGPLEFNRGADMERLQVFTGAQLGTNDLTLREAYNQYLAPSQIGRRAKSTTQQYNTALCHWESWIASHHPSEAKRASTTSTRALQLPLQDPPIDSIYQITDDHLNDWGVWLMSESGPNMALSTAEKTAKFIRAIFTRIGPRGPGPAKRSVGLLDFVPAMDPLAELAEAADDDEGPVDITDEELGRIWDACDIAVWPEPSTAAIQWRTYLVILSVLAPRVEDSATIGPEHFRFEPESPVNRFRSYQHGWLTFTPQKTRRKKGRLIVPLPPCVRRHVGELQRIRGGRMFAWPSSCNHTFRRQWQSIVDQAGLPHIQRRHLRSTANLRWAAAAPGDDLGRWVCGHAARDVNDKHYTRHEPALIKAAPLVEVPEQFNARLRGEATQPFLFGEDL